MKSFLLAVTLCIGTLFGKEAVNDSIVKIIVTLKDYDYETPWFPPETWDTSASGLVIDGNRIMTNAHAVSNASFIQVRSASSSDLYEAQVKVIGHDCDLAILEVEDESFFEGKAPLKFRETMLPQREEVEVKGFPMGGMELSVTKGIVSRSELTPYAYSNVRLLTTQVDAPINPGNSGGPVFSGDEVVGISHQGYMMVQNIGYMIPIPVIRHFLEEVSKGAYEGFPRNYMSVQSIRNQALRKYYGLEKGKGGLLVVKVPKKHFFHGTVEAGDILLAVDGHEIDLYGQVYVEELDLTLPYHFLVMQKHFGDEVALTIIRDGEVLELSALIDPEKKGFPIITREFDKPPSYYILGGLVFQPLVSNLFYDVFDVDCDVGLGDILSYITEDKVEDIDEIVLLTRVLNDSVNSGYQQISRRVVKEINGERVKNLKQMIKIVESSEEPFLFIRTGDNVELILDREEVMARTPRILSRYLIASDRSNDLR